MSTIKIIGAEENAVAIHKHRIPARAQDRAGRTRQHGDLKEAPRHD
jgi:hypothetical protein